MAGVKGRSGKLTTADQKAMASTRGRAAAAARWGSSLPPPPSPENAESDDPVLRLGKPLTWGDELKRQQVEGEKIANRKREVEVSRAEVELQRAKDEADQSRGRLVDRADLDRAVAKSRDAWHRETGQAAGLVLLRLADLPAELRARIKQSVESEMAAAAERVKASLA